MEDFFIEKYKLYHNDVYRIAYSFTLNKQDSEDILQKTFIKFYKNCLKLQNCKDDYIKKWLLKVTINETKDFLKSFWRKHKSDMVNFEEFNCKEQPQYHTDLLYALNKIDKKYRIPFYLYYYEGYDIKEISSIMCLSESAIKSRLSRGREKIKNELEGTND